MRKPLMIAKQARRPSGLLGEIVARIMAKETIPENEVALELLDLRPDDAVLELGSGHGETLGRAAQRVSGRLSGIDFSPVMLRRAKARNRRLVADGRMDLRLGSTDQLPWPDASFDKVYAVHTIYFWAEPLDHLREARRVLRKDGRFVLGFRAADDPGFGATYPSEVYAIRPQAEVVDLIRQAGFAQVELVRKAFGARQMAFAVGSSA